MRGPGDLPVTGYSLCNCLGMTTAEVIASLAATRSGLAPPSFPLPFTTVCGALPGDLPALPARYSAYDCRQGRMALLTLAQMRAPLEAAIGRWGRERVALVMATSTGGIAASEAAYAEYKASGDLAATYDYHRQHTFFAFAELLRAVTGVRGPALVVSTACSSSGKVLGSARRLIGADMADAVLVGGVDTLTLTTLCGFAGLSVLSPEPCRPFSAGRRGMSIGEGGAMMLVEREGEAAVLLRGVGESSDGHHMSTPHPEGLGACLAMRAALAEAGLEPAQIDYVNAHGTGTLANDAAEAHAIAAVLGGTVPVVSTKAFTGHLLGAAGATEAVLAMVAVEQGWIPASLGASPTDPELAINVNQQRTEHACRVVMSNSFGFGGSNVSVVLGAA